MCGARKGMPILAFQSRSKPIHLVQLRMAVPIFDKVNNKFE